MTTDSERVFVTGIGAVVGNATGAEEFWCGIRNGQSHITRVPQMEEAGAATWIGGRVTGFDPAEALPPDLSEHANRGTREELIVASAVTQALEDAGLQNDALDPRRIALIGASSRATLAWWARANDTDRRRSSILHSMPGAATSLAAVAHGIRGPVTTIANGCVSGQQAIGLGCSLLRADDADAVLVVGYDFPLVPELIRLYAAMGDGALCRRRDPDGAMMPYDRHRDGFVLGEGAVALCLQRGAARQFQGRGPYARVIGHRSRCEGGHPMTMDLTGKLTAELMAEALATGGVSPQHVGYICGHGSATHYNDLAEARARAALYPTTAPDQLPPLGSVKPVYGHGLGAAGTLNAAAVALMLRDQCLAPTLNCHDPDPECGPNHVSAGPLVADLKAAVSLAFGLGGQSSVLVMSVAK